MQQNLDRREFLQRSSLAASAIALPSGLLPNFRKPKTTQKPIHNTRMNPVVDATPWSAPSSSI